jgi:hypothetical protein
MYVTTNSAITLVMKVPKGGVTDVDRYHVAITDPTEVTYLRHPTWVVGKQVSDVQDGELTTTFGVGNVEGVFIIKLYVASGANLDDTTTAVSMEMVAETVAISTSTTNQINF